MENNIIDASTAKLNPTDKIIFDCNVLMYIFYTYGEYTKEDIRIYSELFQTALKNGCNMYIPSIEISEFINVYIKSEYKRYLRKNHLSPKNFNFKKHYRKTKDYGDTISEIKSIINRQILHIFCKLDDTFSQIDISNIFYSPELFDFNDRYYCKLAEKHSLIIVTNDSDFSCINENQKIITANRKLLHTDSSSESKCPQSTDDRELLTTDSSSESKCLRFSTSN